MWSMIVVALYLETNMQLIINLKVHGRQIYLSSALSQNIRQAADGKDQIQGRPDALMDIVNWYMGDLWINFLIYLTPTSIYMP